MINLIKYCCDKGLNNFITFKFQRKGKLIMREHFISNEDVKKYNLYQYVHRDKFGRYKLSKYISRKLSILISNTSRGIVVMKNGFIYFSNNYLVPINNVEKILLNPPEEIKYTMKEIQENIEKDIKITRLNKLKNIENVKPQ